ncbi:MAG: 16S rRNA (cytosine(1402)-N(4))-methyltransferase RsmH [Culicoidibacterales bacterium]
MFSQHISVLKDEVIDLLNIRAEGIYIDCTLGAGGHASAILKRLTTGHLYAFDQDKTAIEIADGRLALIGENYTIIESNFEGIKQELAQYHIVGADGILFDIGVSSMQLDQEQRGFSYRFDAPLDMRMDLSAEVTAKTVVNEYSVGDLIRIFYQYGEESYAKPIAKNIAKQRLLKPIESTFELVEIIKASMPMKKQRLKHPAKKIFQAIRIEVNNELEVFETALVQAIELLNPGGRLAVITFHSLEDKICKRIFNQYGKTKGPDNELERLVIAPKQTSAKLITTKPLVAGEIELGNNRRAQSAKLRVLEKR